MEDDSQRRIYQYPNIDGTLELLMGTGYLIAGFLYAVPRLPINIEITAALVTALPFVVMLLFFVMMWFATRFKYRVTHPRTGYATPRRMSNYTVALLALTFGSMLFKHRLPDDIYLTQEGYPLLLGAFLAVVLLLAGQGLKRFYLYAAVPLVVGIGSVATGLSSDVGTALTAFATGLVLVVSGSWVLRRYLARTSPGDV